MGVDISRVVASAIEAALEGDSPGFGHDEPHRGRHRGLKAVAAGAALVGAVQVVRSQAPKLGKLDALTTLGKVTRVPSMVRDMPDRMRDRLADIGLGDEDEDDLGPDDLADEEELDEDEDYDEGEDEPEGDEDEDYDEPRPRTRKSRRPRARKSPRRRATTTRTREPEAEDEEEPEARARKSPRRRATTTRTRRGARRRRAGRRRA